MASSSYNRQILATVAAAWVKCSGGSLVTAFPIGCTVTRYATGIVKIILPTGDGITDVQTFSRVQVKGDSTTTVPMTALVTDESELVKTITTFGGSGGTVLVDAEIEVVVDRSTINL
jgi:hypothetical protein